MNTVRNDSINPARQIAHVATPASKASSRETTSDFHENAFNLNIDSRGRSRGENYRPELYTAEADF
jgi:hypothetical protein